MRFSQTALPGAYLIDVEPHTDRRGLNARLYCEREFAELGLATRMVQTNLIVNHVTGTLRGFHWQAPPSLEAKLFRVVRGAIYDVIIDMRPDSPTFEQWTGIELSAGSRQQLYVPEQFAQGFVTLTDDTEVLYQTSAFHTPGVERGIRWDDPYFGIAWPVDVRCISDKDAAWPDYAAQR
jgi:dTDP-4-dehydrorhamnose 3,5-epimerase